jgi:thimet oligopeptidase
MEDSAVFVRSVAAALAGSLLLFSAVAAAPAPPRTVVPSAEAAPALDWALDAATIKANCAAAITRATAKVDRLVKSSAPRTFAGVVLPLENANADLSDETAAETTLANVATDAGVRDASFTCQNDEGAWYNGIAARPDLYKAVSAAAASGTASTLADRKLTALWLVALKRAGAGLDASGRRRFVALGNELAELQSKFGANLANDKTTISLTAAQIAGLPSDFVATLAKDGDHYVVAVNESTALPFLDNATDPAARKAYYLAANNVAYPANQALLVRAIAVRRELATLLGYPNWASFVLADRMAQSPARVDAFLTALDAKLLPRAQADLERLAALKAKDLGTPTATIDPWDVVYYDNQLRKTQYSVDEHAIAQYFPVDHVERAVFDIYSKLLGVTFSKREAPNVWHSDVTEWVVRDAASGRYLGEFYLDLFPRPGKYAHVANFPLLPYRRLADGSVRPPVSAIIGNFPAPAPGKSPLLAHGDVETFFHEFGHDMAALLATAPYETLSAGFRQDFVEAPSQMLENWVWDPTILKVLSSNVDTGAPLPDDLIAKMRAARYVDNAYFTTRQIMLAAVDMRYHTDGPGHDPTATWVEISKQDSPLAVPEGVHPEAQFGHLMGGYDAGYYGYLWSKVYAQDMFTAFSSAGLEDPVVGARYRNDILSPAREVEPDAEVRAFLGRPMNPDAFYKEFDQETTAAAPAK